jgi:hypothetical protein
MINIKIGLLPDVEIDSYTWWGCLLQLRCPSLDISSAIGADLHLGENQEING